MSNYVRNFGVKNYYNQTTIPQLIANNMSNVFFLKHGVVYKWHYINTLPFISLQCFQTVC